VSRWDDVDRAVGEAGGSLGPLAILDGRAPVQKKSPALWAKVIAINLPGTYFGCKRAPGEMVPAGRGSIMTWRRWPVWWVTVAAPPTSPPSTAWSG
jgi:NAD(P)-dependent dehydrogenase (short-subunit alcohol dehydrogenase family)